MITGKHKVIFFKGDTMSARLIMLDQKWLTKQRDLRTAIDILFRHFEGPKVQVAIQEISVTLDGPIDISRPEWLVELEETFEAQYGDQKGNDIMRRVLSTLIVSGEVVH
jgi:hypothetical protein